MSNIYEIIGKLLAAFFVALAAYLTPKVKAWLEANAGKATQEKLEKLVTAFARAAEQMFHDVDPTGEKRNQFVRQQLEVMGVEITSAVINMIESAVWEINTETKKAQVLDKAMTSTGSIVAVDAEAVIGKVYDPDSTSAHWRKMMGIGTGGNDGDD